MEVDFARTQTLLNEEIGGLTFERDTLQEALLNEQDKNERLSQRNEDLTGRVDVLTKLTEIDEELLQKYSNVYFLNENYMPEKFAAIPENYVHRDSQKEDQSPLEVHAEVLPFLQNLLRIAEDGGISLRIFSAFRSFEEQLELKSKYTVFYGSGANTFSADQGYSEHQLGTTVDFTTTALRNDFERINKTEAYQWLLDNAHRFGFTLSYPEGNAYYVFEPWHWRFVGVGLATKLYNENMYFYEMGQREINEYLISIFD